MGLTDYTISDKKLWQAGRDYEQERIIQTLTNHLTRDSKRDWNPGLEYCYECGGFDYLLPDLIALIKGEQK